MHGNSHGRRGRARCGTYEYESSASKEGIQIERRGPGACRPERHVGRSVHARLRPSSPQIARMHPFTRPLAFVLVLFAAGAATRAAVPRTQPSAADGAATAWEKLLKVQTTA